MNDPIFILGAARSGTSMVAGAVMKCGVFHGEVVSDVKENRRLRENVIKPILKYRFNCDPLGVRMLPPIEDVMKADPQDLKELVSKELEADGYVGGPWMFKDCKLALLWPLFAKVYPNAKWVYVYRDRDEIIDSILRTPFMSIHSKDPSFWHEWIWQYWMRINRLAYDHPVVPVDARSFLNDWNFRHAKLLRMTGMGPSEKEMTAIDSVIDRNRLKTLKDGK